MYWPCWHRVTLQFMHNAVLLVVVPSHTSMIYCPAAQLLIEQSRQYVVSALDVPRQVPVRYWLLGHDDRQGIHWVVSLNPFPVQRLRKKAVNFAFIWFKEEQRQTLSLLGHEAAWPACSSAWYALDIAETSPIACAKRIVAWRAACTLENNRNRGLSVVLMNGFWAESKSWLPDWRSSFTNVEKRACNMPASVSYWYTFHWFSSSATATISTQKEPGWTRADAGTADHLDTQKE